MGISDLQLPRRYNSSAGLSRALVAEFFPGMPSRISGIGLAGLERQAVEAWDSAWNRGAVAVPIGGFYRQRASGEPHAFENRMIHLLQRACDTGSMAAFRAYSERLNSAEPMQLRDLLQMRSDRPAVALEEVESVNEIRKRFLTPGMSMGALSPEAHGVLNVAMNRIGARSVSGEGGEDPDRYKPLPNGDNANSAVKQIASGRFGVTAEYLNQCRRDRDQVAQGATVGGRQLPGFKVTELSRACATPRQASA